MRMIHVDFKNKKRKIYIYIYTTTHLTDVEPGKPMLHC